MRKYMILLMLCTPVVACKGEQGPAGPEGPKGPKGDPGTCDNVTADEVLALVKQLDGADSGLDADTLDGTQLSALLARIEALENKVTALEEKNKEVLYAFDGGGQLLGRVLDVRLDSIVYYDNHELYRGPVEVFLDVRGEPDGQHVPVWYFDNDSCENNHYLPADDSSKHLAVLDQHTGEIYLSTNDSGSISIHSRRRFNDATCESITSFSEEMYRYRRLGRTIDSFQPGVYVGPLE